MAHPRVTEVPDLKWAWEAEGATVRFKLRRGGWHHTTKVDPTPSYGHDPRLVAEVLAECERKVPLPIPPEFFLLHHEDWTRLNGQTTYEHLYGDKNKDKHGRQTQLHYVTLYGKRIPPHPAVTRYLVAHEYGHVVEDVLAARLYSSDPPDADLIADYARFRRVKRPDYYGPGNWHASAGEVFANDFRILVMGVEPEYWPHPTVARPETVPDLVAWWAAALEELAP